MLPELVDKQQAKAAAGDRFDEAAFDAAAVNGRVPRAVLREISSWLQAIRDGATELKLTGPTLLGGRVGAGPAGSRTRGTVLICARSTRLRRRAPRHGRAVLWSCDACRFRARGAPPCRRVTLAVWVGCSARRRKGHRRCRRESSGSLAQEEHDARDALPRKCAAVCSVAVGRGEMWRAPTAGGGRARARARCRARLALVQLGGGARLRLSGPVAGRVWLLLVGA